jgi:hypothetical protein
MHTRFLDVTYAESAAAALEDAHGALDSIVYPQIHVPEVVAHQPRRQLDVAGQLALAA